MQTSIGPSTSMGPPGSSFTRRACRPASGRSPPARSGARQPRLPRITTNVSVFSPGPSRPSDRSQAVAGTHDGAEGDLVLLDDLGGQALLREQSATVRCRHRRRRSARSTASRRGPGGPGRPGRSGRGRRGRHAPRPRPAPGCAARARRRSGHVGRVGDDDVEQPGDAGEQIASPCAHRQSPQHRVDAGAEDRAARDVDGYDLACAGGGQRQGDDDRYRSRSHRPAPSATAVR